MNARTRLRELLRGPDLLVMPGGCSPLYARMAEEVGFESFFLAGSQTAWFLYGVPDVGLLGLRDMAEHARHVAARTSIPVLVDGDTGYGNAVSVYHAVQEFVRAGVAGVQFEDQEAPKKSGTVAGRRCISIEEAVGKYRAAGAARDTLDPEFVVCARCDAIGAEGSTFEEALERCVAYASQGRADLIWLNSVQTREQVHEACRRVPAPVMVIWGGEQPAPSLAEYQRLGVRVALYPVFTSVVGAQAAWDVLHDFKERGPSALDDWAARARSSRWGRVDVPKLLGTDSVRELEEQFLPRSLQRDYEATFGHRPT